MGQAYVPSQIADPHLVGKEERRRSTIFDHLVKKQIVNSPKRLILALAQFKLSI